MSMGHFKNTYRLFFFNHANISMGFPGSSDGKEFACNAGDPGLIPGSRRSPREENGYPLQYSYWDNSMDRGAWQAIVHGVAKNQMQLSDFEQESIWGHNICGHKILWL